MNPCYLSPFGNSFGLFMESYHPVISFCSNNFSFSTLTLAKPASLARFMISFSSYNGQPSEHLTCQIDKVMMNFSHAAVPLYSGFGQGLPGAGNTWEPRSFYHIGGLCQ